MENGCNVHQCNSMTHVHYLQLLSGSSFYLTCYVCLILIEFVFSGNLLSILQFPVSHLNCCLPTSFLESFAKKIIRKARQRETSNAYGFFTNSSFVLGFTTFKLV